jgi:DNA replication protein DnaC
MARFPVLKTLDQFQWTWPKKINRARVQQLLRLNFIDQKANVLLLGGVGLGKTHLATAIGYQACLKGYTVLFTTAVDVINTLAAAQAAGILKKALKKYTKPALLILDELGYLPIDKHGADLLFQIISYRYEKGSIIITSNRAYKDWPEIFNNDATLTSAILDRLLHHAVTLVIEGKSYRMKEQVEI